MRESLSVEQTRSYWEDGFIFPLPVLTESEAATYRHQLETIEQEYGANEGSGTLPRPLADYKRVHSEVVMPMASELALLPAVVNKVKSILGPNVMVWGAEFFIKEPHTNHRVSMHQDLTYWGFGETSHQVTAWIALSPSTLASGCVDLVKGSHKSAILPHTDTHAADNMLSRGQEVNVDVKDSDRTHVVLKPGEMSLHHGLAIHGSNPNQSDDRRIGFAIRYISPDARQESVDKTYAMVASGEDNSAAFTHYTPPVSLFSDASLTLYEDVRAQQNKVLAAGLKDDETLYQTVENG